MPETLWPRLANKLAVDHGPTDAELLRRFSEAGEAEAFTLLVIRHGPMVLSVCKRVLRNLADAEDAFQASFLVLLRRANDIRQQDRFTGWLYGVAYRTAMHVRKLRTRREQRTASSEHLEEVPARPDLRDVETSALVEQELARLPEKFRVAVALCDLNGCSREQAAKLIGIPEGTLSSRLHTARQLLATRLARHALSLSAVTAISAAGTAAPPGALVEQTVLAATFGNSGSVSSIALGVCKAMSVKFKLWVSLAAVAVLGLGVGSASFATAEDAPSAAPPVASATPAPVVAEKADGPGDKKVSDAPPVVVKTSITPGDEKVDPATKEIRVTFNKEMTDKSWSWAGDKGRGEMVEGDNVYYDKDKKTCVMDVKLKPETTYAIWFNMGRFQNFKDADGNSAVPYLLVFRTAKAK